MKINQILDKIDENQLFIPAFQREYVWKRNDAKNLISSLINKYPTGTLLTWETNNPPEFKGDWKYDSNQGAVKLILDGQQRITTLYILIKDKIPPYYNESEIIHDPRGTHGLYVHLKTLDLQYYRQTIMDNDPYWANITDIFKNNIRERDLLRQLEHNGMELSREEEDKISDNLRAIEEIPRLEFVEQAIPIKASLKEAIDIFYIVNASGVNLTEAELALAQISGYWPQARELFKQKLEKLKEEGFDFKLDFIIYCLLGILYQLGSDMRKLHDSSNLDKLKEAWEKLDKEVLDYVINLLRSQAYVDHRKEINSIYALVPIVAYIYNKGKDSLSHSEIMKVIKWFYYSQIRQRYVNQLPQKLDKDIKTVFNSDNPFDELLNNIALERSLEIQPDEFIGVDVRNALYSLMRWYFKSKNAICLTTGVGIRQNMGDKYLLEWDHIFPYSLLKENGYDMNNRHKYALAQEITNRVILTQVANRRKSNKLAKDYLLQVKDKYPQALKLQSIPMDESLWELENFEEFLKARRRLLASELNIFLKSLSETEASVSIVSITDKIQEGESNQLEFKSSFMWNYRENRKDKKMEIMIMKAIASLSNGEGGTLIIGVDDEGNILGLGNDYRELKGDKDEFELHLRNLLNNHFGKVFSTTNLKVEFHKVDDKEVCEVQVGAGNQPLYLKIVDKNDQKQEKFYLRSGNTSQELGLSEISEYISGRF
jgi:uncharacterized protein with ParB-like and HNH nuclease domain/5-methylcytosine-specific restriction endonuclease McrA